MAGLTKIDLPLRPATGPMQIGADWPGVFIRGDEAMALADSINAAQRADFLSAHGPGAELLRQMIELLRSCMVAT